MKLGGKSVEVTVDAARATDKAADAAKSTPTAKAVKEGIYAAPDATAPGKLYVGQSENLSRRLPEQRASGKFPPGTKVSINEVKGGKVVREIAEQKKINELGGVKSVPGSRTSNIRNPISKKRKDLLDDE